MAFQFGAFLWQILLSLTLSVIAYVIMPKPKQNQPDELKEIELPTAEAGKPIPVVFGDVTIKGPNVIWYGEKRTSRQSVDGGGKK